METEKVTRQLVRFGIFDLDVRARSLHKSGIRTKLQGQPFDILVLLISRRGEVVTRDELQRKLWPADTFVDFEHSVNTAVMRLRDALGDSAESPRFIETVPRYGYRFIAPAEWLAEIDSPPVQEARQESQVGEPKRRIRTLHSWTVGLIIMLIVLTIVPLGFRRLRDRLVARSSIPPIQSVVVLPFLNLTGDVEQDYFADGMTEALTTELGKAHVVRIISRTSAMQYKQTRKTIPEIARELNVDGVVEGGVQRSSDRVSITAQLIYAPTDRHLWGQTYERDLRDALAMQREVAENIAYAVQAKFRRQDQAEPAHPQQVEPEAYREYLRGRFFWEQRPKKLWTAPSPILSARFRLIPTSLSPTRPRRRLTCHWRCVDIALLRSRSQRQERWRLRLSLSTTHFQGLITPSPPFASTNTIGPAQKKSSDGPSNSTPAT
jgi:TolB-like protein/DNA-binding winged helix-turn-helix (wHTH) protein